MKAMILAAGRGQRMRHLTENTPKPLLKINGKSLIEYQINRLVEAGFNDIVINLSYLGEQIEQALGDGQRYGATLHYSHEGEPMLGTGGGICKALPLLSDQPFLVVNSDVWTDYPFEKLRTHDFKLAHLVLVENPDHNTQGDFHLNNGYLYPSGHDHLTFSGIGVYHPDLFKDCQPVPFALAPLLKQAMQVKKVTGELFNGQWVDVGTPERLQHITTLISSNPA